MKMLEQIKRHVFEESVDLYYTKRQHQLLSLATLLQARNNDMINRQLLGSVMNGTTRLVSHGLLLNLCDRLEEHNRTLIQLVDQRIELNGVNIQSAAISGSVNNATAVSPHSLETIISKMNHFIRERNLLAECAFYASYDLQLTKNELFAVLKALGSCLNDINDVKNKIERMSQILQERERSSIHATIMQDQRDKFSRLTNDLSEVNSQTFRVAVVLALSVSCALDAFQPRASRDKKGSKEKQIYDIGNKLLDDSGDNAVVDMEKLLGSDDPNNTVNWNASSVHKEFRCWFRMLWALCLNRLHEKKSREDSASDQDLSRLKDKVRQSFRDAVEGDLFLFIKDKVLRSNFFTIKLDFSNKLFYITVFSSFVSNIVSSLSSLVQEMIEEESRGLRRYLAEVDRLQNVKQLQLQQQQQPRYQRYQMSGIDPNLQQEQQVSPPEPPKPHLENLLFLLAEMYRDFPEEGAAFLDPANPPLFDFINEICPNFIAFMTQIQRGELHHSIVPFLGVLNSLAGVQPSAEKIYHMLQSYKLRVIGWSYFFELMHRYNLEHMDHVRYIQQFQQQQQQLLLQQQQQQQPFPYQYQQQQQQQQQPSTNDIFQRHPLASHEHQSILEAILKMIEQVVTHSETARVSMVRNSQWNPLYTLWGMLNIPTVPPHLMGQIMKCMASFIYSQDVANAVWTILEQSNIVASSQSDAAQQSSGIVYQLEQIESSIGKYPETLGFLTLLQALVKQGVPHDTLGLESNRPPGFGPYLNFLVDHVFNKFDTRLYNNPNEKWLIVEKCLDIFMELLTTYEPSSSDFLDQMWHVPSSVQGVRSTVTKYKLPGFEIMKNMLSRSRFQSKIFSLIVDDASNNVSAATRLQAERYVSSEGKAHEKSILMAMKVVELVLLKQESFIGQSLSLKQPQQQQQERVLRGHSQQQHLPFRQEQVITRVNIPPLHRLDVTLVQQPNVIVEICRYIDYTHCAEVRLLSVRIIYLISLSQPKIVQVFLDHKHVLMKLFVDRLLGKDMDHVPENIDDVFSTSDSNYFADTEDLNDRQIENQVRSTILDLLIANVDLPNRNITQLLCGYDIQHPNRSDLSATLRTNSTLLGTSRRQQHCLGAILWLLRQHSLHITHPYLVQQCFELIYRLCSDNRISRATLSYLEKEDFFDTHLLPGATDALGNESASIGDYTSDPFLRDHPEYYLNKRASLMKTVAIDIYVNTRFSDGGGPGRAIGAGYGRYKEIINVLFGSSQALNQLHEDYITDTTMGSSRVYEQQRTPILELLDDVERLIAAASTVEKERIHRSSDTDIPHDLLTLLNSRECVVQPEEGTASYAVDMIDIKALHGLLLNKLGRRPMMRGVVSDTSEQRVVESVLALAVKRNQLSGRLAAIYNVFDGWRQVIEITLSQCFDDVLGDEHRERTLYELMVSLLEKLLSSSVTSLLLQHQAATASQYARIAEYSQQQTVAIQRFATKLEDLISQVVLRLMVKLREQRIPLFQTESSAIDQKFSTGSARKAAFSGSMKRLPVDQCLDIFRAMLQFLLRENTSQKSRGNLYAAILNYIQYTTMKLPLIHAGMLRRMLRQDAPGGLGDSVLDNMSRKLDTGREFDYHDFMQIHAEMYNDDESNVLDNGNENVLNGTSQQNIRRLLSVVTLDAINARNVWKTLALALLDSLFMYDRRKSQWLIYLTESGLLQQLLDMLATQEQQLQHVLEYGADVRAQNNLYVFESMMSFLLKVAETFEGADMLAKNGIIAHLSNGYGFLRKVPDELNVNAIYLAGSGHGDRGLVRGGDYGIDDGDAAEESAWISTMVKRYHQLLVPILRLLVAIFSRNPDDVNLAEQVLHFINSHHKVISSALKDRHFSVFGPAVDDQVMEEVRLTTSIFALLGPHGEKMRARLKARALRYELLLLKILNRYSDLSKVRRNMAEEEAMDETEDSSNDQDDQQRQVEDIAAEKIRKLFNTAAAAEDRTTVAREICRNIICYCRVITEKSQEHDLRYESISLIRVLFSPPSSVGTGVGGIDGVDGSSRMSIHSMSQFQSQQHQLRQQPSLNVLYNLFVNNVQALSDAIRDRHTTQLSLTRIDEYALDQLTQVVYGSTDYHDNANTRRIAGLVGGGVNGNRQQLRFLAELTLSRSITKFNSQIISQIYIVENTLLVLHRHFVQYLREPRHEQEQQSLYLSLEQRDVLIKDARERLLASLDRLLVDNKDSIRSEFLHLVIRLVRDLLVHSGNNDRAQQPVSA